LILPAANVPVLRRETIECDHRRCSSSTSRAEIAKITPDDGRSSSFFCAGSNCGLLRSLRRVGQDDRRTAAEGTRTPPGYFEQARASSSGARDCFSVSSMARAMKPPGIPRTERVGRGGGPLKNRHRQLRIDAPESAAGSASGSPIGRSFSLMVDPWFAYR